jgi:hypothetical protein
MFDLCAPALIYVVFSLTQVIIDTTKGLYNTALVKFIIMVMITILLNALCQRGLGIASWIIVFIPFALMTIITSFLLYFFGLKTSSGKIDERPSSLNFPSKTINKNAVATSVLDDSRNMHTEESSQDEESKQTISDYYDDANNITPKTGVSYNRKAETSRGKENCKCD